MNKLDWKAWHSTHNNYILYNAVKIFLVIITEAFLEWLNTLPYISYTNFGVENFSLSSLVHLMSCVTDS